MTGFDDLLNKEHTRDNSRLPEPVKTKGLEREALLACKLALDALLVNATDFANFANPKNCLIFRSKPEKQHCILCNAALACLDAREILIGGN